MKKELLTIKFLFIKRDKQTKQEQVEHAIKAIENILHFLKEHDLQSFLRDERTISACLYQFSIIGEATYQVENDILEKYPYPWYKIKSFRNFILHHYHGIEMKLVWDTATNLLPELKLLLEKILMEEFKN